MIARPITAIGLIDAMATMPEGLFRLVSFGFLRTADGKCPICALVDHLCGETTPYTGEAWTAMMSIVPDLTWDEHEAITSVTLAADYGSNGLRHKLLEALR